MAELLLGMKKVLKIIGILAGAIVLVVIFLAITFNALSPVVRKSGDGYIGGNRGRSNISMQKNASVMPSWGMSGGAEDQAVSMEMRAPSPEGMVAPSATDELPPVDKKVIRTGSLELKVKSVDEAIDKITQIATSNGGDIFSSNIHQYITNIKSGNVTVKVPVAKFNQAFKELKSVATLVKNEQTSGQDVTEQYTDLQSRLRTKQSLEQAYLKVLEKSGTIKEILDVTNSLSKVREEIEVIQGRIRFMDSQTDMSTINISLTEDTTITIVDKWRPLQVIKEAFNNLVKKLQGFVDGLIEFVIIALPILILWAAIILVAYKIGKKIYLKIFNKNNNINQQ